jgi:hypothetical protein
MAILVVVLLVLEQHPTHITPFLVLHHLSPKLTSFNPHLLKDRFMLNSMFPIPLI